MPAMRDEWSHAERLGLGRGWLYDHLNLNGDGPWHEAYTALAAVAAATSRIGISELGVTTLAVLWPRGDRAGARLAVLEQAAAACLRR
ncbi:LLM class flavin-dependent oxidoreductase [Microbispora sp. ZYX-F-249]|uniref:LLM class flavin-dependent oxidoreductase n=1 Tax=Microbispora maris TaxID=3144104 RepID=A0ABV0AT95_9ACTN